MGKQTGVQGTGSIWTKYRRQKRGGKDGGGKQLKKRAVWGSVHCETHGIMPADGKGFRSVTVPVPTCRREKYLTGCPYCNTAKRNEMAIQRNIV